MEQWKLDAVFALLETEDVNFVEPNERAYISSAMYGKSRYHLVEHRYDNSAIQIEQINTDEKWGSRVTLQQDEVPALLKILLGWYLEGQRPEAMPEESLGDLDDHPF